MSEIPVFVINLARSADRRAFMRNVCARAGIEATFVAAVDGRACRATGPTRGLSKAETALLLSHRKVWRRLLAGTAAFAVVLEDDAHLGAAFSEVPAFDWSGLRFDAVKLETMRHDTWISRRSIEIGSRRLHRLGDRHLGSAGYLVSREGARKFLAESRTLSLPVDQLLFGRDAIASGAVVVFQLMPAVVIQDQWRETGAGLATTLQEPDRIARAHAARNAKPRGWRRLWREAARIYQQALRYMRLAPHMRRVVAPWR